MWICSNNFPVITFKCIETVRAPGKLNASNGKSGTHAATWMISMHISPIIFGQTLRSRHLRSKGTQLEITKGLVCLKVSNSKYHSK